MCFAGLSNKRCLALVALSVISACSGNPASVVPAQRVAALTDSAGSTVATANKGTASFVITIPVTPASLLRPQYTSPATTGMGISIYKTIGGKAIANRRINVAKGAKGCTSSATSRRCTYNLSLAAGKYFANGSTWNAQGLHLSLGQSIPVAIKSAQTTVIPLDLNGVPHSLLVSSGSSGISGSQNGGFALYGTAPQMLIISALDVSGNIIVGVGSPTYKLSLVSGSGWKLQAKPDPLTPNLFTITPPGTSGSSAIVAVSASAPGTVCKQPGAVCGTSFSVTNPLQTLFVGGSCQSGCTGEVLGYVAPYTGSPTVIANNLGKIAALTTNAFGDLFVASCNVSCGNGSSPDAITVYAPPYTGGAVETITNGITNPTILATDDAGALFAMNVLTPSDPRCNNAGFSCNRITAYALPYSGAPFANTGVRGGYGESMAVSSAGLLAVGICSRVPTLCETSSIYVLQPPSYSYYANSVILVPGKDDEFTSLAFDVAGDLFAADSGKILEFIPPFKFDQSPSRTIVQENWCYPGSIALGLSGTLFAGDCAPNEVSIYAPQHDWQSRAREATSAFGPRGTTVGPVALALDSSDNLFIINGDGTTSVVAPPYTGAAVPIASQLKAAAFAVTP